MKIEATSHLNSLQRAAYEPFQGILDGLSAKDHEAVRKHLLPGGMATLIRDGKVLQLDFEAFVARLPTTGVGDIEEVIHEAIVHVDENIAVIWAPYSVLVDGFLHHSGTNIISVILHDGRWLISNVADNSRAAPVIPRAGAVI